MTTNLLKNAGLNLGLESELMPGAKGNPRGFFEHLPMVSLNERLLAYFSVEPGICRPSSLKIGGKIPCLWPMLDEGRLILDGLARQGVLGGKGPALRLAAAVLEKPSPRRAVLSSAWRNPLAIAESLARRDGMPLAQGVQLWSRYLKDILRHTRRQERFFVSYEDFFRDGQAQTAGLLEFLKLDRDVAAKHLWQGPGPGGWERTMTRGPRSFWPGRTSRRAPRGSFSPSKAGKKKRPGEFWAQEMLGVVEEPVGRPTLKRGTGRQRLAPLPRCCKIEALLAFAAAQSPMPWSMSRGPTAFGGGPGAILVSAGRLIFLNWMSLILRRRSAMAARPNG